MSATEYIVRLTIAGRVQGVGFRAFVEEEALERGLRGWVRNRRDGAVEAVIAGRRDVVEDMIAACWRGPPAASVDRVDAETTEAGALGNVQPSKTFSILPTI